MGETVFRFKNFHVSHARSSMKVGVDGVLLGAWAGMKATRILDIGTGCGLISLILAQRFRGAEIKGIDIDSDSINEASKNFNDSPWGNRMKAIYGRFPDNMKEADGKYDLIVSNPPFFDSGITNLVTPREKARHQGILTYDTILHDSKSFLLSGGRVSIIFPYEFIDKISERAEKEGYRIIRSVYIRNNEKKSFKRVLMELGKKEDITDSMEVFSELTLFEGGEPSKEYRALCKDFYLKF